MKKGNKDEGVVFPCHTHCTMRLALERIVGDLKTDWEEEKMKIEEYIKEQFLPVNGIAMANRLIELLRENETNNLSSAKHDVRIHAVMWLLNQQLYGQLAMLDLHEEWKEITSRM